MGETHSKLSDHNLNFLLDQFLVVEFNRAHLKSIPVLLNEAYSRELINDDELRKYFTKIFNKNT
jgi:hypothetical protein